MVNQITADQQRFLCHNSINLNCFTICTDMWDAAAKGQEQVYGENSFWQKHLLTVTWIHCATLTWGWADLAALCWSGRPLVQLHTLHYLWLPSEPLWWQFWAINWLRITGELGRGLYSPTGCSITSSLLPEGDSRMVSIPRPLVSWLPHHHIPPPLLRCTLPPYSYCISWDSKPTELFLLGELPAASARLRASENALSGWPALSAHRLGGPHPKEESQHKRGRGTA